jgi:hypothetical protein
VSLRDLAPGLTPRALLEKFNAMQMIKIIDVHLPTTDGQTIILSRYTQPEADLQLNSDRERAAGRGHAAAFRPVKTIVQRESRHWIHSMNGHLALAMARCTVL